MKSLATEILVCMPFTPTNGQQLGSGQLASLLAFPSVVEEAKHDPSPKSYKIRPRSSFSFDGRW